MANAFLDCRQVESESISILESNRIIHSITQRLGGVSYVHVTEKKEQELFGDVRVYLEDGSHKYIELKAEVRHTGNLFIETWSNYAPHSESENFNKREWAKPELPSITRSENPERFERLRSGSEPGLTSKLGWLEKLDNTDVIIYHFLDKNKAYIISWKAFKLWLLEHDESGQPRMCAMWHAPMGKQTFRQKNRSWGLIVPVAELVGRDEILAIVDVPRPVLEMAAA